MKAKRRLALEIGDAYYFTGKPCKKGHVSKRHTNNGNCYECALMADRIFYTKNKDDKKSRNRIYRHENQSEIKKQSRTYRDKNKDKIKAGKIKRKCAIKERVPRFFGELDELVMQEAVSLAQERYNLHGFRWDIDHMIPLLSKTASGLHCAENIQVIPSVMNLSKGNKMIFTSRMEWLK